MYDLLVDEDGAERVVPHVCSNPAEGYTLRMTNHSRRHIACAVTVDGENALLRDGSLIVAPGDSRKLPGFLISKNFVGKEYVKEYRDFVFGKPKVIENDSAVGSGDVPYTTYGSIRCAVFEAVLDEEVDSDQELRGQTTFYRGAGLHGSFDERLIPEGKKKHFLYSSVTVQGPRSSIANSTRGRWWVRGRRRLRDLEVRYREAHSLMLLGVDPRVLGLANCKEEDAEEVKREAEDGRAKKEEGPGGGPQQEEGRREPGTSSIEVCDLTADEAGGSRESWTVQHRRQAEPVDIENSFDAP